MRERRPSQGRADDVSDRGPDARNHATHPRLNAAPTAPPSTQTPYPGGHMTRFPLALAVGAAITVFAGAIAGSAAAAPPELLPVVIDGVRYSPKEMQRLHRKELYTRVSDNGKTMVGYTRLRDYKHFLASRGLQLPAQTESARPVAHPASAGEPPDTVCQGNFLMGICRDIQSGWGVANMSALNCDFWGCTQFLDAVSSVNTRVRSMLLYDNVGFNMAGCSCHDWRSVVSIPPGLQINLNTLPFAGGGTWNDRVGSLYVFW
jgi:hypothetical protein